jgi:hypothetical protein
MVLATLLAISPVAGLRQAEATPTDCFKWLNNCLSYYNTTVLVCATANGLSGAMMCTYYVQTYSEMRAAWIKCCGDQLGAGSLPEFP